MVLTLEPPATTAKPRRARADTRQPAADAGVRPMPYITADEFATIRNASGLELIDGQIVEREMGNQERWISGQIFRLIGNLVDAAGLGWAYPAETAFQCFGPRRDLVRKADVAFVRRGRLRGEVPPFENLQIAPDLVVEVVSPSDRSEDIDRKVEMYLDAGVPLLWVVFPYPRTVRVHPGKGGKPYLLTDADEIDGGDVLPGFKCRVADFFPPPRDPADADDHDADDHDAEDADPADADL